MKRGMMALVVFLTVAAPATAALAQEKLIKLKDGSAIKGEVVAKSGDVYKIKSPSIGFLSLRDADIASIEDPAQAKAAAAAAQPVAPGAAAQAAPASNAAAAPAVPLPPDPSGSWKGYQDKIMSNPDSMAAIQSLTQDKEIQDIINDPQIRQAIFSGNVEYLKNNEKFLKFANNPTVQKITESALGPGQGAKDAGQDKN